MNRRKALTLLLGICMITTAGSGVALSDAKAPQSMAGATGSIESPQYNVSINNKTNSLQVTIKIPSEQSVKFSFPYGFDPKSEENISFSVESDATQITDYRYKVEPEDGVAVFRYTMTDTNPDVLSGKPTYFAFDSDRVLVQEDGLFAFPRNHQGAVSMNFDLPKNWELYTAFNQNTTSFTIPSYISLRNIAIIAGVPQFEYTSTNYGVTVTNLVMFEPGEKIRGDYDEPRKQFDVDPKINAKQSNKRISYYSSRFLDVADINGPERIVVSPAVSLLYPPGTGMWTTTPQARRHHIARHLGIPLIGTRWSVPYEHPYSIFIGKQADYYLAEEFVYDYTGQERHLGQRYFRFLVYLRAQEKRQYNLSQNPAHDRLYIDKPIEIWYIDQLIQNKTGERYSIKKLKEYLANNYLYKRPRYTHTREFPADVYNVTGADIISEWDRYVLNNSATLKGKHSLIRSQYYAYFDEYLNHHRRSSSAPDILLYSFIDILAKHPNGRPAYLISDMDSRNYAREFTSSSFKVSSGNGNTAFLEQFYQELKTAYPVTREEFLAILNKYTNNRSRDFFGFYSEYARGPSIKTLNAFITGEYQQLIAKQLYVQKEANFAIDHAPDSSQLAKQAHQSLQLLNRSRTTLDQNNLERSSAAINQAISIIDSLRRIDSDDDEIPNLMEYEYGLDPRSNDTDNDGIQDTKEAKTIHLDGYRYDWQEIEPNQHGTKVENQGGSYFVSTTWDSPYYSKEIRAIEIYGIRDSGKSEFTWPLGRNGRSLPPGITNNYAIRDYVYVGKQFVEAEIPKSYLKIHNVEYPSELSFKIIIKRDDTHSTQTDHTTTLSPEPNETAAPQTLEGTTSEPASTSHSTTPEFSKNPTTTGQQGPGFNIITSLVALLIFGLMIRHQ